MIDKRDDALDTRPAKVMTLEEVLRYLHVSLYPLSAAQARRDSSFPDWERLAVQYRDDRSLAIETGNEALRFRFADGATALSEHNEKIT
jgi:hypothetical protein